MPEWNLSNPLPVIFRSPPQGEEPEVPGSSVSVTESALPEGAATEATLQLVRALLNGTLKISDDGGSITVDGTINVGNFPTSQAVAVSNFPASQPVAVNNFPATQPVSDAGGSLTVDGTVGVNNFPATQAVTQSGTWNVNTTPASPSSSGAALSIYRNVALLAAPATIKTSQGRIYGYHFANPNTSWVYVHIYTALVANVVVGTTVPAVTLAVPANSVLDGYWNVSPTLGTGVTIAVTTTATGNTAPATGVLAQIEYI